MTKTIILIIATIIYVALYSIASSIGNRYAEQKETLYQSKNPKWYSNLGQFKAETKANLEKDHYYRFLMFLRRLIQVIAIIAYVSVFYFTLHDTLSSHSDSALCGSIVSLLLGAASSFLSVLLIRGVFWLLEEIGFRIDNIIEDRGNTKKQLKQLNEAEKNRNYNW